MSDGNTFGGFTDAFLTAFRDEFPKLTSLAISFLSNASIATVTAEEVNMPVRLTEPSGTHVSIGFLLRSVHAISQKQ